MPKKRTATLLRNGSQVRVCRVADQVLLRPIIADVREWFAHLDRVREGHFLGKANGRNQPVTPHRQIFR